MLINDRIIDSIRLHLNKNADDKTKNSFRRFFKEEAKHYGVRSSLVSKIASDHWREVKVLTKKNIFELAEELFKSDYSEEAFIACAWLPKIIDNLEKEDIIVFKRWIDTYLNNWAKSDTFCNHTVGDLVMKFPDLAKEIVSWTGSKNRWMKRAAAVTFIVPAKKGLFLKEAFQIADILLVDQDDMVQKGYGWLLKEESRQHQKEVFNYVMRNKGRMPRTALRYAIELMPNELKAEAMKRSLL
jgi:3-methyladenine DNA glycosylase AlkD